MLSKTKTSFSSAGIPFEISSIQSLNSLTDGSCSLITKDVVSLLLSVLYIAHMSLSFPQQQAIIRKNRIGPKIIRRSAHQQRHLPTRSSNGISRPVTNRSRTNTFVQLLTDGTVIFLEYDFRDNSDSNFSGQVHSFSII